MNSSFNPWLKVWVEPRATIARILRENPNRGFWVLASIYGFSGALNWFQSMMMGIQLGIFQIFVLALILSPLWGYVCFSVWSWLVCVTGKWLKGEGTFKEIRAAYAWSFVPYIVNIGLWVILALLFGRSLFANFAPESQILSNSQIAVLFSILLIRIAVAIWSLVIYLKMLAEVRQYSVMRAIGNVVIAGLIAAAAFYLIMWVVYSIL